MPVDRGRRIGAAAGILFVALAVAALLIPGTPPKADELNNEVTTFLKNRDAILLSDILLGVGVGFFLLFLAALRTHLGPSAADGDRTLTNAAVIGGSVGAALLLAGAAVTNGIAFKVASSAGTGEGDIDAVNRAFFDVATNLFLVAGFAFAVFFVAAGLVAAANGSLPRPLALSGLVVGLLQLLGLLPMFAKSGFFANGGAFGIIVPALSLVWILAASVFMFRAAAGPAAPVGATRIADRPAA